MGFILAILACATVGIHAPQSSTVQAVVGTSDGARSVVVAAPANTKTSYFILERTSASGAPEVYGTARFVRWPLAQGGERLELETRVFASKLVISHVERIEPARRTLSWRERSPDGARSVFLQGTGELRGWVGNGLHSRRLTVPAETCLPLEWLARGLRGKGLGSIEVFDPLRLGLRALDVDHTQGPDGTHLAWREAGEVYETWHINAGVLEGYTWRSGLVHARRVPKSEFQRLGLSTRGRVFAGSLGTSRKP